MPAQFPNRVHFALLILLGLLGVLLLLGNLNGPPLREDGVADLDGADLVRPRTVSREEEERIAATAWAAEGLAQRAGRVIEDFWDSLNRAEDKMRAAGSLSFNELVPAAYSPPRTLGLGVELFDPDPAGPAAVWSRERWEDYLERQRQAGWQLEQVEFRQNRFELDASGAPGMSRFYLAAHLTNPALSRRAVIDGDIRVDWRMSESGETLIERIDAGELAVKTRSGEPLFAPMVLGEWTLPVHSHVIDPLLVYDLDGDGTPEIILAAKNLVFRRTPGGDYDAQPLCRHSPGPIFSAVIADFTGDGAPDFLCARREGLLLYGDSRAGTFEAPGQFVWVPESPLGYPQVLTCGDINGDGALDVWLGQYKMPYEAGQMPTPYHDANDGYPAYLLENNGRGFFSDITVAAGLEEKRWRRVYSASFADLNENGILDLAVISDFAGADLYLNDGRGFFTDVTGDWLAEPEAFGMAHVWADLDRDGRLDLLMIGMNSPTADRLDHLGLDRPGPPEYAAKRGLMAYGNRLFQARGGAFRQTAFNEAIARTGWSWGATAFDLDRDGFPEIYIANGHVSSVSVRELEPEFWLHDIYVANSEPNREVSAYFTEKFNRAREGGYSFGGYEKNRLYLNLEGQSWAEIGHLMGVALEQDCRNVVSADLNGDGRMDLLVTTFSVWPRFRQSLVVFQNRLEDAGNWIGFNLREEGAGVSPVGARVTLHLGGGKLTRQIVTGDSFRSQHPNSVHFGLGGIERIERAVIQWPNGATGEWPDPAVNRYHRILYREAGER